MLKIIVRNNTYALQYGTYEQGNTKYIVDCRGVVKQDNFSTSNIYLDNKVCGLSENEKILNQIEVDGLARGEGIEQ